MGSNPTASAIIKYRWDIAQLAERSTVNRNVPGSSPGIPAIDFASCLLYPSDMADFEKLFKKLKNKFDDALLESHEDGHDEGWSTGYDSGHEDGRTAGFSEGVQAHKDMIRTRLTMLFDTYMSTDKFAKAKDVKEMIEYLEWEYDPEQAEKDAKEDDDKWF